MRSLAESLFPNAKRSGAGWIDRCPAHQDGKASLKLDLGDDGRVLVKCFAGCSVEAVVEAAGLTLRDLMPNASVSNSRTIAATYDYTDRHGALLFQVVRYQPKDFRQRRPDGRGGWLWNLDGITPVLFGLPELEGQTTVFICEGEKDVLSLRGLGLTATTNAGGAGKWKPIYTHQLIQAGVKKIVVVPDADAPGKAHAIGVAASCRTAGLTVKVLELPAGSKDVSVWIGAGGTKADLLALVKDASVFVTPVVGTDVRTGDRLVVLTMSTVKRRPVDWIWPRRLPAGKLVILGGEPGDGKSTLMTDVTARITRGAAWPDGGHAPLGDVVMLSAEDGVEDTIGNRLDAAGADDARVHVVTAVEAVTGEERGIDLGRDLSLLRDAMHEYKPVAVVIDPVSAYLPKVDTWRDSEVRSVLAPLAALAEEYGAVVVAIMHLTKNANAKILHRLLGSVGFVAAARVVLAVAVDPDDPDRRLLLPVKNNLAPPADALAFKRDENRIVWDGTVVGLSADAVMNAASTDPADRQDAEAFLRQMLGGGDHIAATDVYQAARKNGIADATLKRAKGRLGVRSQLVGFGREGRWSWWLPTTERIKTPESPREDLIPSDPLCGSEARQRGSERITAPSDSLLQNIKKTTREAEGINRDKEEVVDGYRV